MNTPQSPATSSGVRALSGLLKLLRFVLIFITVLAVPLLLITMTGRGSISVSANLESPYSVELDGGDRINVLSPTSLSYENMEPEAADVFAAAPMVRISIAIADDDRDSRAVVIGLGVAWLAAGWVGLVSLSRVVSSATAGEPFANENPRRLRILAGAIAVVPVAEFVAQALLNQTVDIDLAYRVDLTTWWAMVVVAVGVFALAELFAEAARLREFEAETI